MFGAETWGMRKQQRYKFNDIEVKCRENSQGVTWKERVRD